MMNLADIKLAAQLAEQIEALDDLAGGAGTLAIDGRAPILLSADDIADFVEWKRQRLQAELQRLVGAPTRPPALPSGVHPLPLMPAATSVMLSRAEIEAQVIEEVMADQLALLRQDLIDREQYERRLAQRRPRIDERVAELSRPPLPPSLCEDCDEPATTVIDGRHFCDTHAAFEPRRELVRA